jgi:hypothetical protein
MVQFAVSTEPTPDHHAEPRLNVDRDQVHLVVTTTELDIIADALRSVGNVEFADRLESILRQLGDVARGARGA